MSPNSIYVDSRLFPKVSELTAVDASSIFDSRLRGAEGPHTIRLDIYSVAWDGTSIFGTDKSHLIGRKLPPHKGATRLRHALGQHVEAFTHIVLDPQEPNVVSLVGPSPIPQSDNPEFKLTALDDLLAIERFQSATPAARVVFALLKYVSTNDPNMIRANVLNLDNGWSIECVTTLGEAPAFFLRPDPAVEPATQPLGEVCNE